MHPSFPLLVSFPRPGRSLMYEELGEEWCQPHLFRIGASSLLTDIERQIEHGTSGHYGADYYMPMGSV